MRCFEGIIMIDDFVDQEYEIPINKFGTINYGNGLEELRTARLAQLQD